MTPDGREGLKAANTALIAQYAPKMPKATVKIAVLLMMKATKSALTVPTLAGSHPCESTAARFPHYPHLTPAVVNN
jgi:hypothetical protein